MAATRERAEITRIQRIPRGGGDGFNSGGGIQGPSPIDWGNYRVLIFQEESFLKHKDRLLDITTAFMSSQLGWSEGSSRTTLERGLTVGNADIRNPRLIPSVMLFVIDNRIVATSAQRLRYLETRQAGEVPVLQHLLRAVLPDFRAGGTGGRHIGRHIVQQAKELHHEALWYVHRTQNAAAVYANYRSECFEPGQYYPWDALFNTNTLAQQIMLAYFDLAGGKHAGDVNPITGVSANDFPEPNKAWEPNPQHAEVMEIHDRMKRFGMVFPGTYASHGIARFKQVTPEDIELLQFPNLSSSAPALKAA